MYLDLIFDPELLFARDKIFDQDLRFDLDLIFDLGLIFDLQPVAFVNTVAFLLSAADRIPLSAGFWHFESTQTGVCLPAFRGQSEFVRYSRRH